jgi:chromosome segregation ATPase
MRSTSAALLAGALAAIGPAAAQGQSPTESRLREALRSTTVQLRTAEDDRARLQASEAALKEEVASLRRELATPRPRSGAASAREVGGLRRELAEANRRLEEQVQVNRAAAESLSKCQVAGQEDARARAQLQAEIAASRKEIAAAQAKNARLYQVGKEIIEWLSSKGVATALWAREPFLGLKRVELENVAEGYRDRLQEQRLEAGGRQ